MLTESDVEVMLNQLLAHFDKDGTLEAFNALAIAKELIMPPSGKGMGTYPHVESDSCPCVECWASDVRIEMDVM